MQSVCCYSREKECDRGEESREPGGERLEICFSADGSSRGWPVAGARLRRWEIRGTDDDGHEARRVRTMGDIVLQRDLASHSLSFRICVASAPHRCYRDLPAHPRRCIGTAAAPDAALSQRGQDRLPSRNLGRSLSFALSQSHRFRSPGAYCIVASSGVQVVWVKRGYGWEDQTCCESSSVAADTDGAKDEVKKSTG